MGSFTQNQFPQNQSEIEEFPFKKAKNYDNFDDIMKTFPHLKNINERNSLEIDSIEKAKCFILRSNSTEDIHKAIKYAVWTSTQKTLDKLNEAYQEAKRNKTSVFLYFSVVKSGQFEGVAKLASHVQPLNFPYWGQPGKWRQLIRIEWLYIRNVNYVLLEPFMNKEGIIVSRARDGTEMNWQPDGIEIMKLFKGATNQSIFTEFDDLDKKEIQLRKKTEAWMQNQQQWMQQYQQMMMGMYWQQYQWMMGQQMQMMQMQSMNQQQMPQNFQTPAQLFQNNNEQEEYEEVPEQKETDQEEVKQQ